MFDLLETQENEEAFELKVRQCREVFESNVSIHKVDSEQVAGWLLSQGISSRKARETRMNQNSSRSHSIFTIHLEAETGEFLKWSFVDLAGTERMEKQRGSKELELETRNINKTVFHLNKFVKDLVVQRGQCLSYRNSLLTKLLKESFMADKNVVFVVCVDSGLGSLERSLQSLQFAELAMKLNGKKGKETLLQERLQALAKRNKALERELDFLQNYLKGLQGESEDITEFRDDFFFH